MRKRTKRKVRVSVRESSIADKNEKRKGETESVRENESWRGWGKVIDHDINLKVREGECVWCCKVQNCVCGVHR